MKGNVSPISLVTLCGVALLSPLGLAQTSTDTSAAPSVSPRVYVTESSSWETRGAGGGSDSGFGGGQTGGARPQTAEIIKTFGERCPQVVINNHLEMTDYVVQLDHEGGKSAFSHKNKVAVFVRTTGDSIFSKSTLSLGGSVQDACTAILKHWKDNGSALTAAKTAPAAVATTTGTTASAPVSVAEIRVEANIDNADIEVDGAFAGSTTSTLQLSPGKHAITVKKKGYQPWSRTVTVTGGSVRIHADLEPEAAK